MGRQEDRRYRAELVRLYDYDRYFAAIFAPAPSRAALIALYAFNFEVASIRERVSESLIGEMRLQWWRDAIAGIYSGQSRKHAVVDGLADAIERYNLPRAAFERMIEARSAEFIRPAFPDIDVMNQRARETAGALTALAGRVCGCDFRPLVLEEIGTLWGLVGVLRSEAFHNRPVAARSGSEGVKRRGRADGNRAGSVDHGALETSVRSITERAECHLRRCQSEPAGLARTLRPAFAYIAVAGLFLRRLRQTGYDIRGNGLEPSRILRQAAITKAILFGT